MTPRRLPPCWNWKENRLNRVATRMRVQNIANIRKREAMLRKGTMQTDHDTDALLGDLAQLEALGLIESFRDPDGVTRYAVVWHAVLVRPLAEVEA